MSAVTADEERVRQIAEEWGRIVGPRAVIDEPRFGAIKAEADAIVASGHWTSGPADILTVLGRHRDELFHSRILGWLLTPTGRHGLGYRFLQALCEEVWPGERLVESGVVTVGLEVTRSGANDADEVLESRVDIVVHAENTVIIIENKLDAGEQPAQCERQYWAWSQDPIDSRFVFLTPRGRPPVTATSDAAKEAWCTLSYAQVDRALGRAVAETDVGESEVGLATAAQYLATLSTF